MLIKMDKKGAFGKRTYFQIFVKQFWTPKFDSIVTPYSDGKIQKTTLMLRKGALSNPKCEEKFSDSTSRQSRNVEFIDKLLVCRWERTFTHFFLTPHSTLI